MCVRVRVRTFFLLIHFEYPKIVVLDFLVTFIVKASICVAVVAPRSTYAALFIDFDRKKSELLSEKVVFDNLER